MIIYLFYIMYIEDCKDAQDEILEVVDEAKKFLATKGMKFEKI